MERKTLLLLVGLFAFITKKLTGRPVTEPERYLFKDDGAIPNSKYPLLLYRAAFESSDGAEWLEKHFAANNWTNSWRNGVYTFHHYHSTAHEVMGIYTGAALLHLGGEGGEKVKVEAGDILVIPAGVGHKNLDSDNLGIVGAYANGRDWDVNKGLSGERPTSDQNIAALPKPATDPFTGKRGGVIEFWEE